MSDTAPHKTFAERQRDAAVERDAEITRRFREVADLINPRRGDRVTDVITIAEGSHIAEMETEALGLAFRVVHNGKADFVHFSRLDHALLHLIALRHGDGSNGAAATYAARVLNVPTE